MAADSENPQQAGKGELSVLTMSDDQIMNKIHATHDDHADETFDADPLFIVAQNILKRATHIVDNMVQGTQPHEENLEEKAPSFKPPLCTLKQLSFEMACKILGEQTAEKTTMSILNKLKSYSWHAKAALTLAAFSIEYGDFWLLAQLFSSNQLASSVGILKRVPAILKPPSLIGEYKKEIVELNSLIKDTLEVINSIFELKKLSIDFTQNVLASTAMGHLPVDVYWAIITIVACTTQMCCLTSDEATTQELSPFADKIKLTLDRLKKQINLIQQTKEEEAHGILKETIGSATDIVTVLMDNVQQLFDGSTQQLMNDKDKYIFFYGGKDNKWIEQFEGKAAVLKDDPVIKEARISIELFCIGKDNKGNDDHESPGRIWNKIESLFLSKIYEDIKQDTTEMQEIQKLISFKNESGWVIVSNLSKVEIIWHGKIILNFLKVFENWKGEAQKIDFKGCFKEYDDKILERDRPCCRVDIPFTPGKIPEHMKCPHCPRVMAMETRVNFKCCHIDEAK